MPLQQHPSLRPLSLRQRCLRLFLPLIAIQVCGCAGFMIIESWPFSKALFFTIITISTVGYGDYELSEVGRYFAMLMIASGFCVVTYFVGQLIQVIVEFQLDWETAMRKRASAARDHFIVVGFGRIGRLVCEQLDNEDIPFVVLDTNKEAVEDAAKAGFTAVIDDATSDSALKACGIENARGLLCLTASDSVNIVVTLSARGIHPTLPITSRAEENDAIRKIKQAGANRVISPAQRGAQAVANGILRPHLIDSLDTSCETRASVDFCHLQITPDSPLVGDTLKNCGIARSGSLVPVAIRKGDGNLLFNPDPALAIETGDTLVFAGHPGDVIDFCAGAA